MNMQLIRCNWCNTDPLYIDYHDKEWGVPIYDDKQLFEFLLLEGAQAGLSWITVLKKRDNYRRLFDHFDAEKIASYDERKIAQLIQSSEIIRNRLKIEAFIKNARAYLIIQQQQTFTDFLWDFVDGKTISNQWETLKQVPANTPISDAMSKKLKQSGFTFVGSTICYAFMQAVGMVNDHTVDCYRHAELAK